MRSLIPLLIAVCVHTGSVAAADRAHLAQELPRTLQQLTQAQSQLIGACAAAGITFPPTCADAVSVRQTIAQDWIRRLANTTTPLDETALERFHNDLAALNGILFATTNNAQQVSHTSQRYAHCLDEPVLRQYRDFLGQRVALGLADIAAGRSRADQDRSNDYQRQQRFEAQLQALEGERAGAERFASLPTDHPLLREYLSYCRGTRALVQQPEPTGDDDQHQRQQVLGQRSRATSFYEQLLQHELSQNERVGDLTLPAEAPARRAYVTACEHERQLLRRQLDLALTNSVDDQELDKQQRVLQREQRAASRMTTVTEEWMGSAQEWDERHQAVVERIAQLPAAVRDVQQARLAQFDRERAEVGAKIIAAVNGNHAREALVAMGELTALSARFDALANRIDDDQRRAETEERWRDHLQDPTLAKRFAAYQAARMALAEAQNKAAEATLASEHVRHQQQVLELELDLREEEAEALDDAVVTLNQQVENQTEELNTAIEDAPEVPPVQIKDNAAQ